VADLGARAASIGQGVETVMAQICADGLGTGLDRIRVIHGQTDRIVRGMGAFASRVTVMTGAAVTIAAAKLRAEMLTVAGRLRADVARRRRAGEMVGLGLGFFVEKSGLGPSTTSIRSKANYTSPTPPGLQRRSPSPNSNASLPKVAHPLPMRPTASINRNRRRSARVPTAR
jgi:CO/xanthine dehydrogenase Mo-binding subunit